MRKTAVNYVMAMMERLYHHKLEASELYTENLCVALGLHESQESGRYVKYARRPKGYMSSSTLSAAKRKQVK